MNLGEEKQSERGGVGRGRGSGTVNGMGKTRGIEGENEIEGEAKRVMPGQGKCWLRAGGVMGRCSDRGRAGEYVGLCGYEPQ